jgi:uncharacterized protein
MTYEWKVTFDVEKLTLTKPLFIEGLPGIANVGKLAVDFLVEEFKAKKLCSFYSNSFPHSVFVNEKNLIEIPKIEIYYKKFKNPKKRDLLFLTGDIQPIDERSCYSFCEELLKIIKQFKCKEIITTGGIGLQNMPDKPKVFCTANNETYLKQFTKKRLHVETKIFGVVGPVMGVSGVLVGLAARHNINGAALLAETFGHQMYLGIKGSKELLRVLDAKYTLGINNKRLGKEIMAIEDEVMKKTKEWFSEISQVQQAGAKSKGKDVRYIG